MSLDHISSYPVSLSVQHSVIKHTWIENDIINKQVEGILDIWLDGRRWQALDLKFPALEEAAERFGKEFVDAYSTGKFVDILSPFKILPLKIQQKLKKSLDAFYLQNCKMKDLQNEYQTHLTLLRQRLVELREAWDLNDKNCTEQVNKSIIHVVETAQAVRTIMERIPKGVVIP